jgi:hypothetical protein
VIKADRGRVAVVVVGVTPHQGGMESIPQGKEPQGAIVSDYVCTEV